MLKIIGAMSLVKVNVPFGLGLYFIFAAGAFGLVFFAVTSAAVCPWTKETIIMPAKKPMDKLLKRFLIFFSQNWARKFYQVEGM